MDERLTKLQIAAYHEAGHVMGHWLWFGNLGGILSAEVDGGEEGVSGCVKESPILPQGYDDSWWFGRAVFYLSGGVMESLVGGGFARYAGGDVMALVGELSAYAGITDEGVVDKICGDARDWARIHLWENRETLRALAMNLSERKCLNRSEILNLLTK